MTIQTRTTVWSGANDDYVQVVCQFEVPDDQEGIKKSDLQSVRWNAFKVGHARHGWGEALAFSHTSVTSSWHVGFSNHGEFHGDTNALQEDFKTAIKYVSKWEPVGIDYFYDENDVIISEAEIALHALKHGTRAPIPWDSEPPIKVTGFTEALANPKSS